ncbi:M16 family metallopeptidase [Chlamydiota bacterium]
MYNIKTLQNGTRVISLHMPYMESISVGYWIGVGGRNEDSNSAGISHFLEHLLFKGTEKRNALEITHMIEGAGGSMNAFTSEECTCYFAKVLKNKLPVAIDIISDMFLNAVIREEDVQRERNIILEELHMGIDSPSHHVIDDLNNILWANHSLGRRLIGSKESINNIKASDLSQYKNDYYIPSKTVISIAGNLSNVNCNDVVEKYFNSDICGKPVPITEFIDKQEEVNISVRERKTEQTHMAMGIKAYARGDFRRNVLRLLNLILGGNMSSRLFQTIREEKGLSYDISSSVETFIDAGAIVISAGLDNNRVAESISCILKQLKRLKNEKITKKELGNAKEYAIGRLLLMNEKTTSQIMYAGEQLLFLDKVLSLNKIIEEIEKISVEDINCMANDLFDNNKLSLALIGPIDNHDEIRDELLAD